VSSSNISHVKQAAVPEPRAVMVTTNTSPWPLLATTTSTTYKHVENESRREGYSAACIIVRSRDEPSWVVTSCHGGIDELST
jgi:hypothetical protein